MGGKVAAVGRTACDAEFRSLQRGVEAVEKVSSEHKQLLYGNVNTAEASADGPWRAFVSVAFPAFPSSVLVR